MGKLKMIRVGRILVMALILVGCYPHPHPYYRSPDLSGTLVEKGIPVAGATVLLGAFPGDSDKRCPDAVVVGMTNEKGAFEIRPIIKTQWFQSLLNPPESVLQYTSICFREHESTVLGVASLPRVVIRPPSLCTVIWVGSMSNSCNMRSCLKINGGYAAMPAPLCKRAGGCSGDP